MRWGTFQRSLEAADYIGLQRLNFFGGEPLLNPLFFSMLSYALDHKFQVLIATNCFPLVDEASFKKFVECVGGRFEYVSLTVGRDQYHLHFFDPLKVVEQLKQEGFRVEVQDYPDRSLILTVHNAQSMECINVPDTSMSCCGQGQQDHIGVLPDGSWTICPPSLLPFGTVDNTPIEDIIAFKSTLHFMCKAGCTECLKKFPEYQKRYDTLRSACVIGRVTENST